MGSLLTSPFDEMNQRSFLKGTPSRRILVVDLLPIRARRLFVRGLRLVNGVPTRHGSYDSNVLNLAWVHRVRIFGEDNEVC